MPTEGTQAQAALARDGFATVQGVLSTVQIEQMWTACARGAGLTRRGRAYGGRNLLALPEVRNLAALRAIRDLVEPVLGKDALPVRALFFDKTPEANWPVLWHQDLTIAVTTRHDLAGWGPWSVKAGVVHVEPPADLLAGLLTVRLHLDDCHADNGPLRVIPGSHALGRLSRERVRTITAERTAVTCSAQAGAALLMRPLLLHASAPARRPEHRRVLHIEFAERNALPQPLTWAFDQDFSPVVREAGSA